MRAKANKTLTYSLDEFNRYAEDLTLKSERMLQMLEEMVKLNPLLVEKELFKELQEHFFILSEKVDIQFSGYESFSEMFFAVNEALRDPAKNEVFLNRVVSCAWVAVHYNELFSFFDSNALVPMEKKIEFYNFLILPFQTLPKYPLFSKDWVKCAASIEDADLLSYAESLNRKFLRMMLALNDLAAQQEDQAGSSKAGFYIDSIVNLFTKGIFLDPKELRVTPVLISDRMRESYQNTPAKKKPVKKKFVHSTPQKEKVQCLQGALKNSQIISVDDGFYDELRAVDEGLQSLTPKKAAPKIQNGRLFSVTKSLYPGVVSPDALEGFDFSF